MKIKPEDLKNYIGKKIVHPNYGFVATLLAVGDRKLFIRDACNEEGTYYITEVLWEQYEEPKKKVKMWLWAFKNSLGIYLGNHYYKNEEEAKKAYFDVELLQRADWTEIEVDE